MDDDLWMKGQEVNKILRDSLPESIAVIDNSNVELGHLNRSGLHLNTRGQARIQTGSSGFWKPVTKVLKNI